MLAKAFDILHGVSVCASALRAPTSRTTPIPFTYRGPDGAILSVDCKVKLMKGITAILPHFLAFLPDNVSQHSEKSLVNGFMNKKMVKDNITTGYEAEMFASVLHVIRIEADLQEKRLYIRNNPMKDDLKHHRL